MSASQKSTSIDRQDRARIEAGITALPFLSANSFNRASRRRRSSAQQLRRQGRHRKRQHLLSGSITATVVEVLPNGHLVVTGEKQIGVNQNVDVLRFSGTVDPRAIQPGSIVSSTQVANVRIESRGRGAQAEAQTHRPGWRASS